MHQQIFLKSLNEEFYPFPTLIQMNTYYTLAVLGSLKF